jgi:hypothetical protein
MKSLSAAASCRSESMYSKTSFSILESVIDKANTLLALLTGSTFRRFLKLAVIFQGVNKDDCRHTIFFCMQ